jgi:aminoglycoside phosphotransferase (APT) family kinase protein
MGNQLATVGVDAAALERWIESLDIGAEPPLRWRPVGAGQSNLTYLGADAGGRRWILRRPPAGKLEASAHDVAREHRILSALASTAVPAPRPYGLCDDAGVSDVPLLLMEFVDGGVIETVADAESLSLTLRRSLGVSVARTLAAIHEVDLAGSGLIDLASHKPFAERQLRRWRRQWEGARVRERTTIADLSSRLERAGYRQHETTLVHGDYNPRNVIYDRASGEVTAVLDWELCTLGDPLADLGALLAYWSDPGEEWGRGHSVTGIAGFPTRDEITNVYAAESGRSLDGLAFWQVLALWKLAIIAEGVMWRRCSDRRNAVGADRTTDQVVDEVLERALSLAAEAGL